MFLEKQEVRVCEYCNSEFVITKKFQLKKRFCNTSCSARWKMSQPEILAKIHTKETHQKIGEKVREWLKTSDGQKNVERIRNFNPMHRKDVRDKVSARLKEIGHKPKIRGGNGKGMTKPQRLMHSIIKENITAEYALSLGKRQSGYPTNYKIDLALTDKKIAIEIDGESHYSRKDIDAKKDSKLNDLGWNVIRFKNKDILEWFEGGNNSEHHIAQTLRKNNINI